MEGQGGVGEFQDWEEVQVNADSDVVNSPKSEDGSRNFEGMEAESEGLIRLDYFSLEKDGRYPKTSVGEGSEEGSGVESDNPSWIDPGMETTQYQRRDYGEFWSDSGSDRAEERKVGDFEGRRELGFMEKVKGDVGFEGIVGIEAKDGKGRKAESFEDKFSEFGGKSEVGLVESLEKQVGLERFGGTQSKKDDDLAKFWSDSGGGVTNVNEDEGEGDGRNVLEEENLSVVAAVGETKQGGEETRKVVWWKVPFEMLKYCVLRVGPVWSFSVAVAVFGFVILGRRLYKMKRRAQSLHLKVTVDDKKVSQVMSRAARLNEAFSVVRRVPIVRPLLPPAGVNPWPVMTIR